jgi:hypothetical protein
MLLVLTNRLQQLAHMVSFNNFIFYMIKYFPILRRRVMKQLAHYRSTLGLGFDTLGLTLIILFIIFLNF